MKVCPYSFFSKRVITIQGYVPPSLSAYPTSMFNQKQIFCLANHVKEGLSLASDFTLENNYSYVFDWLYFTQLFSYFFFFCWSLLSSLFADFNAVLSSINEVLWINPSVYVFVFGEFTSIIWTGQPVLL